MGEPLLLYEEIQPIINSNPIHLPCAFGVARGFAGMDISIS